jgi:membrane peptidoglycan carboxypeptidase
MIIDGRLFRNWTDKDSGWFDLKGALVRSFNTYFYQAALNIGDQPILATAREFGFGQPIELPLAGVAKGDLPKRVPSQQGLANVSIGQSPLLSSPLEVAMAMATLADGMRRPKARLVSQVQDPEGGIVSATPPAHLNNIRYPVQGMIDIHNAMYGVVNHVNGTAAKARVPSLRVYGKTGTAQWSSEGAMISAVWFAGFIKDTDPPLAFAVAFEGKKGEQIFGGSVAAPVAGKVLSEVAAKPAEFALRTRKVSAPIEKYTLNHNSGIPIPSVYDSYQRTYARSMPPIQSTVASALPPGRVSTAPLSPEAAEAYFGDYPPNAPRAPRPAPPGAPPGYYYPAPPALPPSVASRYPNENVPVPNTGIVSDRSGPRYIQRAIPVQEGRVPDQFFDQPAPEPNPYYERARPSPRVSTRNGRTRFSFPSR